MINLTIGAFVGFYAASHSLTGAAAYATSYGVCCAVLELILKGIKASI